jgi:hypothetical protein
MSETDKAKRAVTWITQEAGQKGVDLSPDDQATLSQFMAENYPLFEHAYITADSTADRTIGTWGCFLIGIRQQWGETWLPAALINHLDQLSAARDRYQRFQLQVLLHTTHWSGSQTASALNLIDTILCSKTGENSDD